jgi:hypothetical protein
MEDTCICQSIAVKITCPVSKVAGCARIGVDLLQHNHEEQQWHQSKVNFSYKSLLFRCIFFCTQKVQLVVELLESRDWSEALLVLSLQTGGFLVRHGGHYNRNKRQNIGVEVTKSEEVLLRKFLALNGPSMNFIS